MHASSVDNSVRVYTLTKPIKAGAGKEGGEGYSFVLVSSPLTV